MKSKISLGKIAYSSDRKVNLVEIELTLSKESVTEYESMNKLTNAPVLSICGGIWDSKHYDYESCGQNIEEIATLFPGNKKVQRIKEIWEQYHLNDLQAGTKKQCDTIAKWRKENNIKGWGYTEECEYLKSIDLYEDKGIKWGATWLYKPIPGEIIAEIKELFEIKETADIS